MNATSWTFGILAGVLGYYSFGGRVVNAQEHTGKVRNPAALSAGEVALVRISAQAARGNLDALDAELHSGLGAGLTINQVKAALEQLYAYCGFPRSLNGIARLMAVVDDRKRQGIRDEQGKTHEPLVIGDRYERGRVILERLTGKPQSKPAPGFGEFSPEIDRFLKEHLFADIFENPILSYRERELVTIAALASMDGVAVQLNAHLNMGRNVGITDVELIQLADLVESAVSRAQANGLRKLLGQAEKPVVDEGKESGEQP